MQSAAGLPFLLVEGAEVAFVPPVLDMPRNAHVTSVVLSDERTALVTFDTVTDIDTAEALVGCHCLVRRGSLPTHALEPLQGEWAGWDVYDTQAGFLGTVAGIQELPGQNLLEVMRPEGGSSLLIPLVDEFIVALNEDTCGIEVEVPEGLLDL